MRFFPIRTLCLGLLAAAAGCVWPEGDGRVFVTSEPLGAEVLLNGEPTGKTTPAVLDLGGLLGGDHKIAVRKRGFEHEERTVMHFSRWRTSEWFDGIVDFSTPAFPLFWTAGDIVFPLEVRWAYVPHDLHVKLFPEGTFEPKPGRTLRSTPSDAEKPETTEKNEETERK